MTSKKAAFAAAAIALTGLVAAPAQAAVTYSFEALSSLPISGETATGSWSFTADHFITGNTTIPVSELSSCSVTPTSGPGTCLAPSFKYLVNGPGDTDEVATLHFSSPASHGTNIFYYFAPGSFEHFGTYDSVLLGNQQRGILTVSLASSVPEPASTGLLALGLGLLAMAARRTRRG
jgi:hypothetical protein